MKIFNESGMLNDSGKLLFEKLLNKNIKELLNTADSKSEAQIISSLIFKQIGDLTFDHIQNFNK